MKVIINTLFLVEVVFRYFVVNFNISYMSVRKECFI